MITLSAENRQLTKKAKHSYLSQNYTSSTSSFVLKNSNCAVTNKFALFGEWGSQQSEYLKITGVTASTNTITTSPSSRFAHPQDTKVTIIEYNQVRYYQTAAAIFSNSENPLTKTMGDSTTQFDITNTGGNTYRYTYDATGTDPDMDAIVEVNSQVIIAAEDFHADNNGTFEVTGVSTNYFEVTNASGVAENNKTIGTGSIQYSINVQANRTHTIFQDTTNTTGYGWFCFYNSTTEKITTNSNAIPYAGFDESSVRDIFDAFFSQLNNKEMSLVNNDDAFRWLNEGFSKMQNALNLVNPSYKVEEEQTITTVSGIQEYALEDDFGDLVSITDEDGRPVGFIKLAKVPQNDADGSYSVGSVRYFLRGSYIGFSPVPTSADTFNYFYKKKTTALSSYYENVDLPDNNFYPIVNYMMFKAAPKLGRTNAKEYLDLFKDEVKEMQVVSHKQNANLDQWSPGSGTTV